VEHAGYWVFDLTSVAGRTCTHAELVLDNAVSGFRENIALPKPPRECHRPFLRIARLVP
jgi:hypothetical protein